MNKRKPSVLPSLVDPSELADSFADYFSSKIDNIRAEFPDSSSSARSHHVLDVPKLEEFIPVSESHLREIIMSSNSKSCHLDPIPISLLKASIDILLPVLCKIVNSSIESSTVPASFKSATITPLLKKSSLDKEVRKNYRPISNLPFIAKLIEKVIVQQLNSHMLSYGLHEPFQSAYRRLHSTETALLRVYNDILGSIDNKNCVMLILLDLSAAFDTLDHVVLPDRLEHAFGVTGNSRSWLTSYLNERYQSVRINGSESHPHLLKYGMPQGSVIGPFGFPCYSSPIGAICRKHNISYYMYADDTQIYLAFAPDAQMAATAVLEDCIEEIRHWMVDNFLKLNESKTEFLLLSSQYQASKLDIASVKIGDESIKPSDSARNLGAIFDHKLTMIQHVNTICQSCYVHIWNIGAIRQFLTRDATEKLVHAFITSRLDYSNSLLVGLPKYLTYRLQLIQNTAARIVTRSHKYQNITPVLCSLHWLPVDMCIVYKIALLTFKCLNNLAPLYLSELLIPYEPS